MRNRETKAGQLYGACMLAVGVAAAAYHATSDKTWRPWMRRLDYWTICITATSLTRAVYQRAPPALSWASYCLGDGRRKPQQCCPARCSKSASRTRPHVTVTLPHASLQCRLSPSSSASETPSVWRSPSSGAPSAGPTCAAPSQCTRRPAPPASRSLRLKRCSQRRPSSMRSGTASLRWAPLPRGLSLRTSR